MPTQSSQNSDGILFMKFLFRHKNLLIFSVIIVIVSAIVVTLLLKPLYESQAVIFPTPTNSPDKILEEPQFGYEVDADWLMQVLKSDIVRDSLNKQFNLINYFEIDTSKQLWLDDFRNNYNEMIDFERTKYMSIKIIVTTHNPEFSAKIANYIIDNIDAIREKIFKANTYQTLLYTEKVFIIKNQYLNLLVDSIYSLRNKNTSESLSLLYNQIKENQTEVNKWREELNNIRSKHMFYNLETQVENLNLNLSIAKNSYRFEKGKYEVYLKSYPSNDTLLINSKARAEGAFRNIKEIESELKKIDGIKKQYQELTEKIHANLDQLRKLNVQYENTVNAFEPFTNSIKLERLTNDYAHQQKLLNDIRFQYENSYEKYYNPIPSVYVINRAEASYKKSSPILWKISLIIFISTMIFVIGILLLIEKYRSIKHLLNDKMD